MGGPAQKPPPRVLFLDHVGVLGGAELCLIDLVQHMRDRSKVLLFDDGPLRAALESIGADVAVHRASKRISKVRRSTGFRDSLGAAPHVLMLACRTARLARRYDLIWANSQKSFVIGCVAACLSRRPLVWHMHDILTADHFSAANRRLAVRLANKFATRVVTVSDAGRQSFIDSNGRPELVRRIYNGINPASFGSIPGGDEARQSLRGEFSIGQAPLIGVFGRISAWKGQDILIRALPDLPGVHAVIVGDALFNEKQYGDSLHALADRLGVADRTHFAGFRRDIAGAMGEVDVVAHTSTAPEPFGRVIVEAMLARRPVIASAAGGAAEIVTHGKDGLLVEPGSPPLLAAAISQLLGDPDLRRRLVEQGYQTATTQFSLRACLNQCDAVACETQQIPRRVKRRAPDRHELKAVRT